MIFRTVSDSIINVAATALFWFVTPKQPHNKFVSGSIATPFLPLIYPWWNKTNRFTKWDSNSTLPYWANTLLLFIYLVMFIMTCILIRSLYLIERKKQETKPPKPEGKQQFNFKSTPNPFRTKGTPGTCCSSGNRSRRECKFDSRHQHH